MAIDDEPFPLATPLYTPGSPPDSGGITLMNTRYFAPIPPSCVMECGWWCRTHVQSIDICIAVLAEREACAVTVEGCDRDAKRHEIAAAIRARP